jgi:hypothetical protein
MHRREKNEGPYLGVMAAAAAAAALFHTSVVLHWDAVDIALD